MNMQSLTLRRTTFKITTRCTLKCKLCQAFIPYYVKHDDISFIDAKLVLSNYFAIVDNVGIFSITGGEPLLNKCLSDIIEEVLKYSNQIQQTVDIVTNGTLMIDDQALEIVDKYKNKVRIIISDYGKKLSTQLDKMVSTLESKGIQHRIENYRGDEDCKYGGWIDYRDNSLKHIDAKDIESQALNCFWRQGHYYEINLGELHPCARSFWRMYSGITQKDDKQYINLLDDKSIIEKKNLLAKLEELVSLNSCAYCDGNKDGSKRYMPAEQL